MTRKCINGVEAQDLGTSAAELDMNHPARKGVDQILRGYTHDEHHLDTLITYVNLF